MNDNIVSMGEKSRIYEEIQKGSYANKSCPLIKKQQ